MSSSYVSVDYDLINQLFKKRGTTRSKCAEACGIPKATLGNAFMRRSKMRSDQIKKIASFLEMKPIELLARDKDGNILHYSDWEAITSKDSISAVDKETEDQMITNYRSMISELNEEGKEILETMTRTIFDLLEQIPKYQIDYDSQEE